MIMRKDTNYGATRRPRTDRNDPMEQRILRLQDAGWQMANISHLTGASIGQIRKVLIAHNIEPLM